MARLSRFAHDLLAFYVTGSRVAAVSEPDNVVALRNA